MCVGPNATSRIVRFTDSVEAQNILDKYRKMTYVENNSNGASISSPSVVDGKGKGDDNDNVADSVVQCITDEVNDQLNIHCEKFMFENAKKKLRYVLSNTEIQRLPRTSNALHGLVSNYY